ncbi:hypothetical protein [Streptosporangium saharense]|uniref:hypothetical protein n=1 Tax=Streptosporangium saharense TaxID=1706840 RepID=UPI003323016F
MRPRDLPKIRDRIVADLTNPASVLRQATEEPTALQVARALQASDLWWVAPDMAALAVAAGAGLPDVRWSTADRPSGCGMVVWDGGIGQVRTHDAMVAVDALSWGSCPEGFSVVAWIRRTGLADVLGDDWRKIGLRTGDGLPALVPVGQFTQPVTADRYPAEQIPERYRTVFVTLAAAWLLMEQPTLVERRPVDLDRPTRSRYGRAGRPQPKVSLVELRRQYVPQDRDPDAGTDGRRYRNRWVVRGHWRHYTDERFSEELRESPRWIPHHVKGPEGAPLLVTEKVNVWRR